MIGEPVERLGHGCHWALGTEDASHSGPVQGTDSDLHYDTKSISVVSIIMVYEPGGRGTGRRFTTKLGRDLFGRNSSRELYCCLNKRTGVFFYVALLTRTVTSHLQATTFCRVGIRHQTSVSSHRKL